MRQFVEELGRHDISVIFDQNSLRPGEDTILFMERGISESGVTVLICTESYTRKADARQAGGVGFETILSAQEYLRRPPAERARFMPVIRNNNLPAGDKLPRYLGGALYIDMSGDNWRSEPMTALVKAIKRHLPSVSIE